MDTLRLGILGAGLLLATAPISAQSLQSTTSREVISATGCVRQGGTDGAAHGEGLGPGYVLTGMRVAPHVGLVEAPRAILPGTSANEGVPPIVAEPGSRTSSTDTGAIGADASARPDTGLLLVADRGVDLAGHLGHRVVVTGRLSSFAAAGGVASTSSGRTLTVTKVDLIAPSCTTGS